MTQRLNTCCTQGNKLPAARPIKLSRILLFLSMQEIKKIFTYSLGQDQSYFKDPEQDFIDPCCGDGTLLGEALIRKCQNGIEFEKALSRIKGCDIEPSNVEATKNRLLCGREDLRFIVDENIIVGDALESDLLFGHEKTFGPNGLFTIKP